MLKSGPTPRTVISGLRRSAVDRHAGDALQRFGQVGVGEFTDVFGHDAVHDTVGIAFQVQGRLQAGADTSHNHFRRVDFREPATSCA
jgi:hypothetical protein